MGFGASEHDAAPAPWESSHRKKRYLSCIYLKICDISYIISYHIINTILHIYVYIYIYVYIILYINIMNESSSNIIVATRFD